MQIIGALALTLVITVSLAVLWLFVRLANQVKRLEKRLDDQMGTIEKELCVIMEGALGLVTRLQDLNSECAELRGKQLSMESQSPANLSHDQAVRMVAQGAGVDELVERCGLPRSEAELLVMLNTSARNQPAAEEKQQPPESKADAPQSTDQAADTQQQNGQRADVSVNLAGSQIDGVTADDGWGLAGDNRDNKHNS